MEISIVIPVYNKAAYLERCLASIFRQDYDDYEIVAIAQHHHAIRDGEQFLQLVRDVEDGDAGLGGPRSESARPARARRAGGF